MNRPINITNHDTVIIFSVHNLYLLCYDFLSQPHTHDMIGEINLMHIKTRTRSKGGECYQQHLIQNILMHFNLPLSLVTYRAAHLHISFSQDHYECDTSQLCELCGIFNLLYQKNFLFSEKKRSVGYHLHQFLLY